MKIEDQVCSFEQAKRLYELGVGFVWSKDCPTWTWEYGDAIEKWYVTAYEHDWALQTDLVWYPAYTVAELGVLLPKEVMFPCEGRGYYRGELTCYWFDGDWCADYTIPESTESLHTHSAETEAQDRAAALIWLIENKHVDPKELKL
jgi:hypothetical protein